MIWGGGGVKIENEFIFFLLETVSLLNMLEVTTCQFPPSLMEMRKDSPVNSTGFYIQC